MSGRYGPYVKWGKINATLPQRQDARSDHARRSASRSSTPGQIRRKESPAKKAGEEECGEKPSKTPRKAKREPRRGGRLRPWRKRAEGDSAGTSDAKRKSSNSSRMPKARSASAKSRAPSGSRAMTELPSSSCSRALEKSGKLAEKVAGNSRTRRRLPPVAVLEVTELDADGELIAIPVEWDEAQAGKPPRILIRSRTAKGTARSSNRRERATACWPRSSRPAIAAIPIAPRIIRTLTDRAQPRARRLPRRQGPWRAHRSRRQEGAPRIAGSSRAMMPVPQPGELVEAEIVRGSRPGLRHRRGCASASAT